MAEKTRKEEKRAKKGDRVEKKSKGKKSSDKEKSQKKAAAKAAFSLLADEKSFDTGLSSLFSNPTPLQPAAQSVPEQSNLKADAEPDEDEDISEDADADLDNVALEDLKDADDDDEEDEEVDAPQPERKRKRARKDGDTEVEDAYMDRLARDEERDEQRLAAERATKRQKADAADSQQVEQEEASDEEEAETGSDEDDEGEASDQGSDDDAASPPPKHETQQQADDELAKANRTVFLGNVSTEAIASKSARRSLTQHLSSFFPAEEEVPKDTTKPKVESIRFRSTPYSSSMPKKAAYAKKELMDATTKSTNAYAVYSTAQLSREAARRLNGTVVLDRHLRVDSIAHPAKTDHKRCVFVGNLGFVDDETNVQQANREDGREDRKPGKQPADIEEGLWRTFARCGKVESVRVIRDSTTRVGKGIAYVQFEDENAVEAALLLNEKKFPPMLPRKLRVSRAKAQKRNAKPGSGRPGSNKTPEKGGLGYKRKISGEEASQMGRAGKLYGRAAAAKMKKPGKGSSSERRPSENRGGEGKKLGEGILAPESFVFEGHRASSKAGKPLMKFGSAAKKKGPAAAGAKPSNRSAKRGAAFKSQGKKKA
ncbi:RNA-binding domain-containing protein [Hortaea werneckii]|nr:RNA-binding domain-containing protein [Hortaea werneckii]KAI6871127.1 RNA-binding domain-containing protein [Hortaea werneckii]KAI7354091.1 RNA-binding domain-containing protein [Hortaea werneckii]